MPGPNTNGSQFFITHRATSHLNYKHTIFGHVVSGQDVVNAIRQGDKIRRIEIIRNGDKAKNFATDQAAFDKLMGEEKIGFCQSLAVSYADNGLREQDSD